MRDLCKVAEVLDCSLDWLLLRTEVPRVGTGRDRTDAPQWRTGTPPRPGRYLCSVDMGTTKLHEQQCDWDGQAWTCYGRPLDDLFAVEAWWPLPPRQEISAEAGEEAEE